MAEKLNVPGLWSAEMGLVIAKQNELAGDAFATDVTPAQMRENYDTERAFWNEGGPQMARTTDREVATAYGAVSVRQYRPEGPAPQDTLPVIVFIHGGGWVVGNPTTHDRITRILADSTKACVVSVDYTLSPEAKYPRALNECVAVVRALVDAPDEWGIDADDISLAGDSGGASLAFGVALHLRDEEKLADRLRCMLLYYGIYGLTDSASRRLLGGPWDGLGDDDLQYYYDAYFGSPEDVSSPWFNVVGADLGHGVPPCYVAAAALDPLRDDSRTLAAQLALAGVTNQYEEFAGVIHGFAHHTRMLSAARRLLAHSAQFFTEQGPDRSRDPEPARP
ncbi:alpha/beta hydrolase fold domain-containing protein [Propionibacterium freudenreichii]|uniref:alpha/beta hydrolase fold domain-containing protein n=1 Tax=Propionibacterium freudenreichii TaxID=1744 RepID=UPI0005428413|nr:alpha/beta hydrolase fold domain-containing protein [Propionibacterium freudenreichii]MCT2978211.1 steryl acetyl hydrolase [Propionibacterium freudenreichii]MCT2985347.1 steryl acetyl hydrolase [Propionibacterium freudenreichii]MCT2986695.1 steryl acetyl hydrolase [Propionibacterium freudenreichii]MCT2990637.1 steryl acetyl hydrolase [Propionibacterium freudenreichii]MCT2993035.1 steryl acetyl hydrolase [Propionibacterium freudenreichii]